MSDSNLVPREPNPVPDMDPSTLSHGQQLTWERRWRLLKCFDELGTIQKAAATADISRSTVEWWTQGDKPGFFERYRQARADSRDHAEDKYILHPLDNLAKLEAACP